MNILNKVKKRNAITGFTLMETMLYLAIAGALAVGLIAATLPPIGRQRYNSAVQTFQSFLQGLYSSVTNVQNVSGNGRSGTVIYGKLIVYGITTEADENTFYVFDIMGDKYDSTVTSINPLLTLKESLNACIFTATINGTSVNPCDDGMYADVDYYTAISSGNYAVDFTNVTTFTSTLFVENATENHIPASGAILIIRSPSTGSVQTYATKYSESADHIYWNDEATIIDPQEELSRIVANLVGNKPSVYMDNLLGQMEKKDINFCLYSSDVQYTGNVRRNVRISKNATNSSGVIIEEQDSEYNVCRKS